MKTLSYKFSAFVSRICAACLPLLGFTCSSCESECMYGTPTGTFEVKGEVTTKDGIKVANATVRITPPNQNSGVYSTASVTSDTDGAYTLQGEETSFDKMKVVCLPDDPTLEADSVIINMKYVKAKKDKDSWSSGHADASANFTLKQKKGNQ